MGLPQYNTEQLIANIKRRCSVPTSQLTFTDEDFTLIANDQLQDVVVPLLMSTREEYFVTHEDFPTPSDGVLTFPSATVASKVRSVCFVQQTNPLILWNIPRIDLDVVAGVGFTGANANTGFYIEGNELKLYPNINLPTGNMVRIYFYQRTLALAAPSQYGRVISTDPMTNTLVLDAVPSAWTTQTILNSVSGIPAFQTTNSAIAITAISSPSIICGSVDGVSVGDYISEEGFSAIPQVMLEAHGYLAQLSAVKCLEGLGDQAGKNSAKEELPMLEKNMFIMTSQRVDGSVKKIVNPSGGLRLGAGIGRSGGWSGGTW